MVRYVHIYIALAFILITPHVYCAPKSTTKPQQSMWNKTKNWVIGGLVVTGAAIATAAAIYFTRQEPFTCKDQLLQELDVANTPEYFEIARQDFERDAQNDAECKKFIQTQEYRDLIVQKKQELDQMMQQAQQELKARDLISEPADARGFTYMARDLVKNGDLALTKLYWQAGADIQRDNGLGESESALQWALHGYTGRGLSWDEQQKISPQAKDVIEFLLQKKAYLYSGYYQERERAGLDELFKKYGYSRTNYVNIKKREHGKVEWNTFVPFGMRVR